MHDYIERLREHLGPDDLISVFATIEELNGTPICKNWVDLISAVGVEGMLILCQRLGDRQFRIPTLYEVLVVYAALMTIQKVQSGYSYSEAKELVLGGIFIEGFDVLTDKLRMVKDRSDQV